MADNNENVYLTIQINGQEKALKTLKDIRQARKDLTIESINGDKEAAKSLADLNDKFDDLKESVSTFQGSGIERLQSSFSLLGQGLATFDFDKIKTGFKGIGAAMGAIPIFLLVQGITLLIENFDAVIDAVKDFVGVSKEGEIQAQRLTDKINAQSQSFKDLLQVSQDYTSTRLLQLKALGAGEKELADAQRSALIYQKAAAQQNLEDATKAYNALLKNIDATDEQFKNAQQKLVDAKSDFQKINKQLNDFVLNEQISTNQKLEDEDKKLTEEIKKQVAERKAARQKQQSEELQDFAESLSEEQKYLDQSDKDRADKEKEKQQQEADARQARIDQEKQFRDAAVKEADKNAQDDLANTKKVEDAKNQIKKNSLDAAKNLSDLFFNSQIKAAGGNQTKLNEIAKKQFEVQKAFNIAQATIDGYSSAVAAYRSLVGIPVVGPGLAIAAAAAAGIAAATNIAKIASTQFNSSSAPTSLAASAPSITAPNSSAPVISQNNFGGFPIVTNPNNNKSLDVKATVVETDVTDVQDRVSKIKRQAAF